MNHDEKLMMLEDVLKNNNVDYAILKHDVTLQSAQQGADYFGISLQETTPTLIVKIQDEYVAVIVTGNSRISFKKLKQIFNVKDVSLADPQTILNLTGAHIGQISLVNPDLRTLVDIQVTQNQNCWGGCGVPQTTLKINTQDLIKITQAQVLDFTEPR